MWCMFRCLFTWQSIVICFTFVVCSCVGNVQLQVPGCVCYWAPLQESTLQVGWCWGYSFVHALTKQEDNQTAWANWSCLTLFSEQGWRGTSAVHCLPTSGRKSWVRVPPLHTHAVLAYKIVCGMFMFYTVYLVLLVYVGICLTPYVNILAAIILILYATDTHMLVSSISVVNLPCWGQLRRRWLKGTRLSRNQQLVLLILHRVTTYVFPCSVRFMTWIRLIATASNW